MSSSNVTFTRGTGELENIAYITLDRPEKLNGLTLEMLRDLTRYSKEIAADRSIRAVIVQGAEHNFCAGLDFGTVMKNPMDIAKAFAPPKDATPELIAQVEGEEGWILGV